MKKNSIIIISLFMIFSCKKWIDPDLNINPNQPVDVPMHLILPSIQVNWSYIMGGELARPARTWMQQITNTLRWTVRYDSYNIFKEDMDYIWKNNTYSASLMDTKLLIEKAKAVNSPAYLGIAQVLWVYQFLVMTDLFGDIPYSEALQRNKNMYPRFDKQEEILKDLEIVINSAINNLKTTTTLTGNPLYLFPESDDLIYRGDINLWLKAAYAIKARLYLHWGERESSKFKLIQNCIDSSFTNFQDDMVFNFGNEEQNSNPLYQLDKQRGGILSSGYYFVNLLNNGTPIDTLDDDPRINLFTIPTGGDYKDTLYVDIDGDSYYDTVPPGSYLGAKISDCCYQFSSLGTHLKSINSPVYWITYSELKFIEAELNIGTPLGDYAYVKAVKASYSMYGLPEPVINPVDITLADIIGQKYLGLVLQIEVYNDYRRTGLPVLETYDDLPIPKRYPYGAAAFDYNPDNVITTTDINTPVWWNE